MGDTPGDDSQPAPHGLEPFQLDVTQLFFSLPASRGFLLAGGAALLAQQLTSRPTRDLDFFTAPNSGNLAAAATAFEAAARDRGWHVHTIQRSDSFVRLNIEHDEAQLLVDLAVDAPPARPASITIAGPSYDPEELAGRKMIALFDRAEARDFVDVYLLAQHYPKHTLLAGAAAVDPGFDPSIFADMLSTLSRFTDADLPLPTEHATELRHFFSLWSAELTSDHQSDH